MLDSSDDVYRLVIPKVDATFVGTGDLFACSLLTWLHKDQQLKVQAMLIIRWIHRGVLTDMAPQRPAAEGTGYVGH